MLLSNLFTKSSSGCNISAIVEISVQFFKGESAFYAEPNNSHFLEIPFNPKNNWINILTFIVMLHSYYLI